MNLLLLAALIVALKALEWGLGTIGLLMEKKLLAAVFNGIASFGATMAAIAVWNLR